MSRHASHSLVRKRLAASRALAWKSECGRTRPNLWHPLGHAAWSSHGRLQVPKQPACLRDLFGECLNHPRQSGERRRTICPMSDGPTNTTTADGKCSRMLRTSCPMFGQTIGPFGPCHAGNRIPAKLKQNHGRGVRGLQPIPIGTGKPLSTAFRTPPRMGRLCTMMPVRRSQEHTTQGVGATRSRPNPPIRDITLIHPDRRGEHRAKSLATSSLLGDFQFLLPRRAMLPVWECDSPPEKAT